jgi:uncharacterized cupin superfamily protein
MEKAIEKVWGSELELVNNEKYCSKFLHLNPGFQCSLHRHKVKDETFYVMSGECWLEYGVSGRRLQAGERQRIVPGTLHRFSNHSESTCLILEVSTHHSDSDVIRIEPSAPITLNGYGSQEAARNANATIPRKSSTGHGQALGIPETSCLK